MLWEYQTKVMDPVWPPKMDEQYPEVALRGLAAMLPRMKEYFGRMPRPQIDGGYYTKTRENRPLVGADGCGGRVRDRRGIRLWDHVCLRQQEICLPRM